MSAQPVTRYPRGGSALWTDGSDGAALINAEFFGAPAPALDVPTIGASVAAGYSSSTVATTAAVTTQASTSLLVFCQWESTSTPPVITDSKGNTYSAPIRTLAPGGGSITNYLGAWFLAGATGGASHTFTATGGASTFPSIWVVEVIDAATQANVGATALATPFNSGNIVTTGATRLVGFAGAENTSTVTHTINSAGYTRLAELTNGAAAWTGVTAHREAAAGTYSFEVGVTSSQDGGAILVALAKAGGSFEVVVTPATYSLTGASATTLWRRRAQTTPGSYSITGQAAQTRWGRRVDTTAAAYTITGSDADLIYTPIVPALTLDVTPGSYALTGVDAAVRWGQRLNVTPAAFTVTGQTVTVRRAYRADVSPGAYTVAGVVATLEYSGELPPEVTVEYQTMMRRRRRAR